MELFKSAKIIFLILKILSQIHSLIHLHHSLDLLNILSLLENLNMTVSSCALKWKHSPRDA